MREHGGSAAARMSLPVYDDSEWPIFRVTMPPVRLSDQAFQAHLDACSSRYEGGRPFCMLIDMGEHPAMDAVRRKAVADRMKKDGLRVPGVMLGCALVVRSAMARGGVTAINWIAKPPYPFIALATVEESRGWLVKLLEQRGIRLVLKGERSANQGNRNK